jgi:hypothetical protein
MNCKPIKKKKIKQADMTLKRKLAELNWYVDRYLRRCEKMKHGEIINQNVEKTTAVFDGCLQNGEAVSTKYTDSEATVTEQYCKYCNEIVSNKGNWLIGSIQCSKCGNKW